MKHKILSFFCLLAISKVSVAQSNDSTKVQGTDSIKVYRKRVLESTEVSLLMSFYNQDGSHSPVNGGIGTEKLEDKTPTLVISIPLNNNDVLTVDAGISAYTSASSSNINPFIGGSSTLKSAPLFTTTAASRGGGGGTVITTPTSTPTPTLPSKPHGTPS